MCLARLAAETSEAARPPERLSLTAHPAVLWKPWLIEPAATADGTLLWEWLMPGGGSLEFFRLGN